MSDKDGNLTGVDTYDSEFSVEEIAEQTEKHMKELKEMNILLPCPFCGGQAELYDYEESQDIYDPDTLGYVDTEYYTMYGVGCTNCGCIIVEKTEKKAIEAWNTRKPMEQLKSENERLKVELEQEKKKHKEDMDWIAEQLELHSKLYSLTDKDCEFAIPMNAAIEIIRKCGAEGKTVKADTEMPPMNFLDDFMRSIIECLEEGNEK